MELFPEPVQHHALGLSRLPDGLVGVPAVDNLGADYGDCRLRDSHGVLLALQEHGVKGVKTVKGKDEKD